METKETNENEVNVSGENIEALSIESENAEQANENPSLNDEEVIENEQNHLLVEEDNSRDSRLNDESEICSKNENNIQNNENKEEKLTINDEPTKEKSKKKNKRKVKDIVTWSIVGVLGAIIMTVVIMLLIGFKPAVVMSPSMKPNINPGDLVVFKECDFEKLEVGDVITFYMTESSMKNKDVSYTHRIIEIYDDGDGTFTFKTQGDANKTPDSQLIPQERVLGEVQFVIPWIGRLFFFLKNNLLVILGVASSVVIFSYILSIYLKEQKRKKNGGDDQNNQNENNDNNDNNVKKEEVSS